MTRIVRCASSIALALLAAVALAGTAGAASGPRAGDGDGAAEALPKPWAKRHHVRRAAGDPDRDGLSNWGELRARTRPRRADTDGDGILDGDEHAGLVEAFGGGTLTIALAAGGSLSAALDERTDVSCGGAGAELPGDDAGSGEDDGLMASLAEQGEEDDPDDERWDDRDCSGDLVPGARVREAQVEDGAFVVLELGE